MLPAIEASNMEPMVLIWRWTKMTNIECKDMKGKIGGDGALDISSRLAGLNQAGQRELKD